VPGQPGGVGGGHHQPQPPIRTLPAKFGISRPPSLRMAVAEAAGDLPPPAGPAGAAPAKLAGRLDWGTGLLGGRPGAPCEEQHRSTSSRLRRA
jgi:hypothetical protein